MLPTADLLRPDAPAAGGDDEKGDSIFDLLQHRTDMSTLFAALASVGMLEDLQGECKCSAAWPAVVQCSVCLAR